MYWLLVPERAKEKKILYSAYPLMHPPSSQPTKTFCDLNSLSKSLLTPSTFPLFPITPSEVDIWIQTFSNKISAAISFFSFSTKVESYFSWWFPQLQGLKSLLNKVSFRIHQFSKHSWRNQLSLIILYAIKKYIRLRYFICQTYFIFKLFSSTHVNIIIIPLLNPTLFSCSYTPFNIISLLSL